MNQYEIEHRVRTLSILHESFEYKGFNIDSWDYDIGSGTSGDGWIFSKTIEAKTANEAFRMFIDDFSRIVDRIAFVSQCFTTWEHEPFKVYKINQNPTQILFFRYTAERSATHLNFLEDEKEALVSLDKYEEKGDVFRLLREAAIGSSFYTRFTMLVAALEAIAGEEKATPRSKKRTNYKYIREEILKDDNLFDEIFKYGDGLRNKLLHGSRIDLNFQKNKSVDFIDEIYLSILRYFREKHSVELAQDIVNPLRHPIGSYVGWKGWIEPIHRDENLNLFGLHRSFGFDIEGRPTLSRREFNQRFRTLTSVPGSY